MIYDSFDKKWFGELEKKMFNFALVGPILLSRKNLQKQFSFVYAQVLKNELTPLHVDYHTTLVLVAVFYFMLITLWQAPQTYFGTHSNQLPSLSGVHGFNKIFSVVLILMDEFTLM